jgi:hypothetical protein
MNPYYLAGDLGSPLQEENVHVKGELYNTVYDNSEGDDVFMKLKAFEKRMSSNKHNATLLINTQTIPNERNLSLDNDLCKDYVGGTEAINHNKEDAEMIELGAIDIEVANLDEEDIAMIDLPAPSTVKSSTQHILDNPTIEDTSQPIPRYS